MIDINLTNLFDDFYHTRFFVLLNLSLFSFLFALRLDETIEWSYWLVFMPLWIWKVTAFFGMVVGTISWCRLSRRRFDSETFLHYKAMLISFSTNLILFLFEIIVCDKLESQNKIAWSICFIPLFILSLVSIGTCIWSIRHDRSYEIELFCALNLLQFVFISLRLDSTITWSWVLVLIPLWILMCIAFIILLYFVIITIIILSRNHPNNLQHHTHYKPTQRWLNVIYYTVFLFSLLAFEIVLTHKLDAVMSSPNIMHHFQIFMQPNPPNGYLSAQSSQTHQYIQTHNQQHSSLLEKSVYLVQNRLEPSEQSLQKSPISHLSLIQAPSVSSSQHAPFDAFVTVPPSTRSTTASTTASPATASAFSNLKLSYFLTVLPLQLTYLCLILLSFNSHSGNLWWFGMRRDFCELFLIVCPVFKIYGNVQLKFSCFSTEESRNRSSSTGEPRSGSVLTAANPSSRPRNLRNTNRTGSASEPNDSVQQQQQQSLIAASAAADANSNETSLVTLNIFRSQSNPSHPTTLRGTGGAASTISQQNQLIASDFDEISSMDDCLDVALTTLSTSSSGTTTNNLNVVSFQAGGGSSSVNNNRRIKFLNKKFNLKRNFKTRNVGSASQRTNRRSSTATSTAAGSAGGSILTQQAQASQSQAQPPQQPLQQQQGQSQRQYSFRSYHSAYSSDRCSEKSSRKSKNHTCLPLSHLHGSSRKQSQPQPHQLNKSTMGTIIQLDMPD